MCLIFFFVITRFKRPFWPCDKLRSPVWLLLRNYRLRRVSLGWLIVWAWNLLISIGFLFIVMLKIICCFEPILVEGESKQPAVNDTHYDQLPPCSCFGFYSYYWKDSSNSWGGTSSAIAASCPCPLDKELVRFLICV